MSKVEGDKKIRKLLSLGTCAHCIPFGTNDNTDGGGIRGLSSIMILEQLLDQYNGMREDNGLQPQEPWQVFDLIGGTSTGGYV